MSDHDGEEEVVRASFGIEDGEEEGNNTCRMYRAKYPQAEDLVLVQVKNVAEMGAYVSLLEYGGVEGMILLSELSRRRIRSINKLIRVGRTEVVVVLRVDEAKGYIDLSKRRVTREDVAKCEAKYDKSKKTHAIMRHVSEATKVPIRKLYEQFGWDLYDRFGHAYEAFKMMVADEAKVGLDRYNLRDDVLAELRKNITKKMQPTGHKIRADVDVTCFSYAGIDAIKEALGAAEALSTEAMKIKIKLVAPPTYVLMTTSFNKTEGISKLQECVDLITAKITVAEGECVVKEPPRTIHDRDDRLLAALMESLERQNQEVGGDDADDNTT